jgi:hypothetical protein
VRKTVRKLFRGIGGAAGLAALLLTGCSLLPRPVTFTKYEPGNIYRKSDLLPPNVKRLAVLPLTVSDSTTLLENGAEILQPALYTELEKTKRFEVIVVSPEQLRQWTGQARWKSAEPLPADFFARLRQNLGNDAVMFCELTSYQPYPPIAIGWKLTLVTTSDFRNANSSAPEKNSGENPEILWSADEVFNAGNPEVANAAQTYTEWNHRNEAPIADSSSIFSSPFRFGQYTLNALFQTLPAR